MNLLDSHDTERLLWTLTPGRRDDRRTRGNAGERRRRASCASQLASLIQFTVPGRADGLLRRRGRHDRRRRSRRPADVSVGRPGRLAGHGAARPLHALAALRDNVPALTRRRLPGPARGRRRRDGRLRPAGPATPAAIVALNRSPRARPDDPGRRLSARRDVAGAPLRRRRRRRRQRRRSPAARSRSRCRRCRGLVLATGRRSTSSRRRRRPGCRSPAKATERSTVAWNAVGRRGRLRRLRVSPLSRRRLRQGQRGSGHGHVVHDHRARQRAARPTSSSAPSTLPATRAVRRTRSSRIPHLDRSAGRTSSGRRR